jgi:hypothetical protein
MVDMDNIWINPDLSKLTVYEEFKRMVYENNDINTNFVPIKDPIVPVIFDPIPEDSA